MKRSQLQLNNKMNLDTELDKAITYAVESYDRSVSEELYLRGYVCNGTRICKYK